MFFHVKKNYKIYFVLLLSILLVACAEDNTEEPETALDNQEATDEALFSVLETNVAQLMEKNYEGYMNTIHTASPSFDTTSETVEDLFAYDLVIELSDLHVKEKSAEEARIGYTQRTVDINGTDFEDNETIGEHVLRLDDEEWKIFHSEVIEMDVLEREEPQAEEVALEGTYADLFLDLDHPFEDDDWVLVSFDEMEGEARAEYIHPEENLGNYSEIIAIEYYEDGNELSNLAHFISVFEWSLIDLVGDHLEFDRLFATESEVMYEFTVTEDEKQENQHEIGRIFVKENDIYLARYTVIDESIENEEEVMELLQEVH